MVSSLICAALFVVAPVQKQDRQNLLNRVIPHPTGANGYEEYLRAAEIASDSLNGVYDGWSPGRDLTEPTSDTDPRRQLIRHLNTMNVLDVRKEQVKRFGEALDLVRQGNQKVVTDPRQPLTPESVLPELGYFRRIARLFTADAYTKFAEGKSSAGTKDLTDGLVFSYNISGGSLISSMVGISTTSIILAECSDRLGSLSLDDCRSLQQISTRLLQAPLPLAYGLEGERSMMLYVVRDVFTKKFEHPEGIIGTEAKGSVDLVRRIKESTSQDRERWQASITNIVNGFFDSAKSRLQQPEANWSGLDADVSTWARQDADPVVKYFVEVLFPIFDSACMSAARSRTQLRLLNLSARVLEYHWLNNSYPSRLSDLGPDVRLKDPFSGEDFVYEQKAGGFRLYSKGVKWTGEIELRYRRTIQNDDDTKPVPE